MRNFKGLYDIFFSVFQGMFLMRYIDFGKKISVNKLLIYHLQNTVYLCSILEKLNKVAPIKILIAKSDVMQYRFIYYFQNSESSEA